MSTHGFVNLLARGHRALTTLSSDPPPAHDDDHAPAFNGHDDGSSETTHLVLLCVMGGVLIASSLEAVQHRLRRSWIPASSLAVATGLLLGICIRAFVSPDAVPEDLVFNGRVFFLVALPIIIFEAGYSLRKKEFFSQLFTILTLSIVGTAICAGVIGGILFAAGSAGASLKLDINEALAYGSILSATDAYATTSIIKDIGGVDPSLQALVQGEGSVNDAVSIVLFQTFAGFYEEGIQSDTAQDFLSHFFAELLGSLLLGTAIGVLATFVFRLVHMGWLPDVRDTCFCCVRPRDYYLTKAASASAPDSALRSAAREAAGERVAFARAYSVVYSSLGHLSPPAKGSGEGRGEEKSLVAVDGAKADASCTPLSPQRSVSPKVALWLRLSRPLGLRERRLIEARPLTSVFAQTSFIILCGYVAYLSAEACHLSGVVSVLFSGIALNHFVRPLLSAEGKEFSEGTVRVLSATADTSVFFQVGLDIALTMGTDRGIDTAAEGEMVGWVFLALLVSRAVAIFPLALLFNYFRREKLSWRHQVLMWHSAIRGASAYAFTLVFPTANKPVLVDLTAAMVLISVLFQATTMKPLFLALGEGGEGHHDEGGGGTTTAEALKVESDDEGVDNALLSHPPPASPASGYNTVIVQGARVYIPTQTASRAERVITWLNRVDTQLRWIISGIVRGRHDTEVVVA